MRATRSRRSIELTTGRRNSDEEMSYGTRRRSLLSALDRMVIDSLARAGWRTEHLNRSPNRARVRSGNLAPIPAYLLAPYIGRLVILYFSLVLFRQCFDIVVRHLDPR
jgi:hypothetical protein